MKLHLDFKLNGFSFTSEKELLVYAKQFHKAAFPFLKQWFDSNDSIIVQTSGSTGKPKDIVIKKEFMVNSAQATQTFFNLPSKTNALLCLSPNYIAGKMMWVRAMTLGWHLDVVQPNANPLKEINKTYDFSAMVPLQVAQSITHLDKVKKLIVGGAAISSELLQLLQKQTTKVFATYGMTETVTHIAVCEITNNEIQAGNYKILPDVKISKDNRGCLVIHAPKISESKVITNDLVNLISETSFELLGRIDNIINSGGVKIIPEQVEAKLAYLINRRFFIAGIPDEKFGEKVVLVIEGNPKPSFNLSDLKVASLSKYEFPKQLFYVNKFVETNTGKIVRKKTLLQYVEKL